MLKAYAKGNDWQIPIYGVDTVEFARKTVWEVASTIAAPQIAAWKGDEPVSFGFKFELVAGVGVESRKELVKYIRIAHALNAGSYDKASPTPPPVCILILGSYIACKGLLTDISVTANPPWGLGDSTTYTGGGSEETVAKMRPTSAVFSGTFMPMPGMSANGQIVKIDQKKLSSADIHGSFYNTGGLE